MPSLARFVELSAGAGLSALGLVTLQAFAALPEASPPRRTPTADEPPSSLGPRAELDESMATSAAPVASYDLAVRLDAEAHSLTGTGRIHWTNASTRPVDRLYFHLYLNAFKNNRSLFLRSPFGRGRSGGGARSWGRIDLTRLVAPGLGNADLLASLQPADARDAADETDVVVQLPEPVAPGESLDLELAWDAQLPEIVERTGYVGSFHMIAQWFPKLARLEPSGTWAHFPFHPQSEFYSDFGDYRVEINVPSHLVVGATGALTGRAEQGKRVSFTYSASSVHDFVWTAWDGFQERSKRVDGVDVRVLFPVGFDRFAEVTFDTVGFGLDHYGRAYGRYPYSTLTVVVPPEHATDAGGMEYPTLITTGGHWLAPYVSRSVELLTLHELAHQWFYGLVATNEHAWPFLDEGLTSYAEARAIDSMFPTSSGASVLGLEVDADAYRRAVAARHEHDDVVAVGAPGFANFRELGALVYSRTAVLLDTLGNSYGRDELDSALGRYARHYRYRHPTPKHLLAAIEETMGPEATEVARRALFDGGWIDYAAVDLRNTDRTAAEGIFDEPSPEDGGEPWYSRVLIKRRGTLQLPVEVALTNTVGETQYRTLDGRARTFAVEVRGEHPIDRVQVDPRLEIPLDGNLLNNSVRLDAAVPWRLTERLTYWTQLALAGAGP